MIIIDKNLYDLLRLNRFVSWLALRFGEARGYPCANGLACWEHGNLHREDPTCATNTFWLSNITLLEFQRLWCPKTSEKRLKKRAVFGFFSVRNHPVYMGRQMVRPGHRPLTIKAQDWLNVSGCLPHDFVAIFDSPRQAETRELDTKMQFFGFPLWTLKWHVCQNSPAMFFCLCGFCSLGKYDAQCDVSGKRCEVVNPAFLRCVMKESWREQSLLTPLLVPPWWESRLVSKTRPGRIPDSVIKVFVIF